MFTNNIAARLGFKKIALLLLGLLILQTLTAAPQRPNVLVILTDDMGYADVSCYGGKFVRTPNIDQLAKEGTRFTQFYVTAPICSPSRAGLLTGMYPARWKLKTFLQTRAGNRAAGQVDFLDPKAPTMARAFKNAGYATAHIGKWHLGGGRDVTDAPKFVEYGYDEHASTYESPEPEPDITATNWIWSDEDKVKRWDRSSYFVDKTLDFLSRKKEQPCFINFWPDDVHTPWVPSANAAKVKNAHEAQAEFKGVLAEYDRQVGRLMAGLKKLGLDKNTIVIFASDNGPGPDFPGNPRSLGMRGQKASLYEGGIRMPFIVRWPGKTPAGRVDEKSLISSVDLFPTLCQLAGVPLPKNNAFDGEDLSAALLGKSTVRERLIHWEFGHPKTHANESNKKNSPNLAVREGKWKLLVNADGTFVELYDLESDRNETRNMAKEKPEIAHRLTDAVMKWKKTLP